MILEDILKYRTWTAAGEEDRIRWCASMDGEYKVKIGYRIREAIEDDKHWPKNFLWGKFGMPKAEVFSWLEIQKKILTQDRLAKFGISGLG